MCSHLREKRDNAMREIQFEKHHKSLKRKGMSFFSPPENAGILIPAGLQLFPELIRLS